MSARARPTQSEYLDAQRQHSTGAQIETQVTDRSGWDRGYTRSLGRRDARAHPTTVEGDGAFRTIGG